MQKGKNNTAVLHIAIPLQQCMLQMTLQFDMTSLSTG